MHPLTHSYFLLLPLRRLFLRAFLVLLGICLLSLWSLPFLLHTLVLISLFLFKMRISFTLTLSSFTIRFFGQTALFFSAKTTLAYLPTALSVVLKPFFPSQQAQHAQVSLLKPGPFCKLFAGLGSTDKSATSLFFFSYLTLTLSSTPCPLLHLSFYLKDPAGTVFSLLLLYQATMGSRILISPGERRS